MTPRRLFVALMVCFLSATGGARDPRPGPGQVLELCDVLAHARAYQGKQILVRGIYFQVFHGSLLFAPGCTLVENPRMNMRSARDFHGRKADLHLLNRLAAKGEAVSAVYEGTFDVARIGKCFGQTCLPYELEATELVSAQASTVRGKPGTR